MTHLRHRAVCAAVGLPAATVRRLKEMADTSRLAFVPFERPDDPGIAVADAVLAPVQLLEAGDVGADGVVFALVPAADPATVARALALGAWDVFTPRTHPVELSARLVAAAARAATIRGLRAEAASAEPIQPVGRSDAFTRLRRGIEVLATAAAPLLFVGETGSGRTFAARYLHSVSGRRERPFLAIDARGLGPAAARHRLFGEGGGAFRTARGGTVLVTSAGHLDTAAQEALARWVRTGEVSEGPSRGCLSDARLLVTEEPPESGSHPMIPALRSVVATPSLSVPPLRERSDDAVLLLAHFLQRRVQVPVTIEGAARDLVLAHRWPGNVAEVRAVAEILALRGYAGDPGADRLFALTAFGSGARSRASPLDGVRTLDEVSLGHVLRVLDLAAGNRTRAAKALGIAPRTLYNHLRARPAGESESPPR